MFVVLVMPFSYEEKTLNNAQLMHLLTNGMHDSKHAQMHVPKAASLNTHCKLICADKLGSSVAREHLLCLNLFASL